MTRLKELKKPIAKELKYFEQYFRETMRSDVKLLDRITYYIYKRKGKQLRPMFVLYCAAMCGKINKRSYIAASMVELLHTASLVHDDVVDDAQKRRGFFSINALWKNKAAVLVGDYLLSKGLLISTENNETKLLEIMSNAVREMSEGELLQMQKTRTLDIDEDTYFEIIRKKTASLIAASCQAGAKSTTDDPEILNRIYTFGEKIGLAFQIKDDLFDYGNNNIGKPVGNDIKEKKITLPLIYFLNNQEQKNKRKILRQIRKYHDDTSKMKKIIKAVRNTDALEYTQSKMLEFKDEALEQLNYLPDNPYVESMRSLVQFVIERKK